MAPDKRKDSKQAQAERYSPNMQQSCTTCFMQTDSSPHIPILVHDALVRFKCLSWFCNKCKDKVTFTTKSAPRPTDILNWNALHNIEIKLENLDKKLHEHMKEVTQSVKAPKNEAERQYKASGKLSQRATITESIIR